MWESFAGLYYNHYFEIMKELCYDFFNKILHVSAKEKKDDKTRVLSSFDLARESSAEVNLYSLTPLCFFKSASRFSLAVVKDGIN